MLNLQSLGKDFTTYSHTKQGEILDWCPTFLPSADHQLLGGIPLSGRVTEIYGKPSAGKSTLVMTAMKHLTDANVPVVYLDVEGTTSAVRMRSLGIDTDKVILPKHKVTSKGVRPLSIENIQSIMTKISALAIQQKQPVVFVWDTVAMTKSEMQLNASSKQQTIGAQARAINKLLGNLNGDFISGYVTLICLNQARANTQAPNKFAARTPSTDGGLGLEHAVSLKLLMNAGQKITKGKEEIGHHAYLKFSKSKIGGNAGTNPANIDVLQAPGMGCDFTYNLYDEARNVGMITGTAWQTYKPLKGTPVKEQGSSNFIQFLRSAKGKLYLYEIWQRLVKYYFPHCYPPLFNERVVLTSKEYPFLKGMRAYYIKQEEKLPTNHQSTIYLNWKSLHPNTVKKVTK